MEPPNPPPPPPLHLRTIKQESIIPKYYKKHRQTFRFSQFHPTQFHGLPDPKEQEIESRLLGLDDAMQGLKIAMDARLKSFIPPRIAKANPSVKSSFKLISLKMSRHTDELRDESFMKNANFLIEVILFMKHAEELVDMIYPRVEMMMGLSSHDPRVSLVRDIVSLIDLMIQTRGVPLDDLEGRYVYNEIMTAMTRRGMIMHQNIQDKLYELVLHHEEEFIQTIINTMRDRVRGDAIKCRRLIQILMNENEIMSHPLMKLFKSNKAVYEDFFNPGNKAPPLQHIDHYYYIMRDQLQLIRKMCGKNIRSWNISLNKHTTVDDLNTDDSPYADKVNRLFVFGRNEYRDLPKDIADDFKKFQKDEVFWLSGGRPRSKCRKTRRTKTRKS
jgi:hypothetical protein